ncbi:MAG: hypothetical protein KAT66_00380 [Candidatus Lokiarchaeota archaeon]|nr:hypothetical protein [Candidatus Lokiarchaeota archaeon]
MAQIKTVEDLVKEVLTAIKKVDISEDDDKVITYIDALVCELNGSGASGKIYKDYSFQELSRISGTLAILKVNLGEIMSRAKRNKDYAELQVAYRKAKLRRVIIDKLITEGNKRPTVDDIDAELTQQVYKEKTIALFRTEFYERVNNLWWSLSGITNTIEMRVKVLMSERFDSKLYDNTLDINIDKPIKLRKEEELRPEENQNN